MSGVPITKQHLMTKWNSLIQHIGPILLPDLHMLLCQIKSNQIKSYQIKRRMNRHNFLNHFLRFHEPFRDANCFARLQQHYIAKIAFLAQAEICNYSWQGIRISFLWELHGKGKAGIFNYAAEKMHSKFSNNQGFHLI